MRLESPLGAELLRELLEYDPGTGALKWKPRTGKRTGAFNRRYAGTQAGTLRSDGYIALKVKGRIYAAHRVIWAMVHDEWPECVRHINRNGADNRLTNLKAATRQEINHELAQARPRRPEAERAGKSKPREWWILLRNRKAGRAANI